MWRQIVTNQVKLKMNTKIPRLKEFKVIKDLLVCRIA